MSKRWSAMAVLRRMAALAAAAGVAAILGVGARTAPAAEDSTLLGQWRFDERDGQVAVDDGPLQLNGLLGATDVPDVADPARIEGASGRALRFASNSVVRLPDSRALAAESLTAEAVVRADGSPGQFRYLVSRGGERCVAGSYGLYTGADGGVALYVFDGTRYVVSAAARPADVWNGAWHHVAGTFDGRALQLFVDGRPVGEPMDAPLRINYATTSVHAWLGQYAGDCDLGFHGDIDLVRLWSGARSAAAVAAAAAAVSVVSATPVPLPAAAPGTVLPASPRRACVVQVLSTRAKTTRRTMVQVRVTVRNRPLRAARVVARTTGTRKVLARARTDATGRARLALRARPSRRVRITAPKYPRCAPAQLRVRGA